MSAQHIPAPWFWSDNVPDAPKNYCTIVDADGFTIAEPSPMGEANARLIAAAPDLLDVLQEAVKVLDYAAFALDAPEASHFRATIADARAAIAKATGDAA